MGFADITGYKIEQLFPGQATTIVETPANTYTAEGLTNGTNYRFRISSINSEGYSATGTLSTTVAPQAEPPGQPTIQSVTAGNAELALTWSAPSDDGGAPIDHYKAEFAIDPYTVWPSTQQEDNIASTSFTFNSASGFNSIINDSNYRIRVYAKNSVGYGPASELSSVVTPNIFNASGGAESNYTDDGGVYYKAHTFTSSSTTLNITGSKYIDFLIVAGGGGGGSNWIGGGGGGGGMIVGTSVFFTTGNYTIVVGNGGFGGRQSGHSSGNSRDRGENGGDSTITGPLSFKANGGGGGSCHGAHGGNPPGETGKSGGSGGGGTGTSPGPGGIAEYYDANITLQTMPNNGQANISSSSNGGGTVTVYGNKGSVGRTGPNNGAGGGGAGGGGGQVTGGGGGSGGSSPANPSDVEDGGNGKQNNFHTGSNVYYAGGGGGGVDSNPAGTGGHGGGGKGSNSGNNNPGTSGNGAIHGLANTGGGGGGGPGYGAAAGANGGSGIVVIRYVV
jgi:hypothetical protein